MTGEASHQGSYDVARASLVRAGPSGSRPEVVPRADAASGSLGTLRLLARDLYNARGVPSIHPYRECASNCTRRCARAV